MDIRFEPAPKTFKRVKSAKLRLTQRDGSAREQELTVWLKTAGTPTFCVSAPPEYRDAWAHHRSEEYSDRYGSNERVSIADGWIHAATFDAAVDALDRLSLNYAKHMGERNKRKVIVLNIETKSTELANSVNAPSFSSSRILVGLRADVYWDVNGHLYMDDRTRPGMRLDEGRDPMHETEPSFEDLHPAGSSTPKPIMDRATASRDKRIAIPFTPEAWSTVLAIETTLERAAAMLVQLTGGQAQALLEGGMQGLLAGPATQGAEL